MNHVKRNVIANLVGNVVSTILSVLFVPLYIRYMGIEAWGLVGFFTTLQIVLVLADIGLSTTINREFARTTSVDVAARRDLLRTLEVVYWTVAIAAGTAVVAVAPFLAERWLQVRVIPLATVRTAVALMGVVAMLQLPLALYSGGLLGLQRQVRLNAANTLFWTARSVGSLMVLAFIAPTVIAYFLWQVAITAAHTFTVAAILWRALRPAAHRAAFRRDRLLGIWRFSTGMFAIGLTGTLLTQIDKIVLSKILPLEIFGYYALASVVAAGMFRIINPVFSALFPRFTELVASDDLDGLKRVYHAGCQLATVAVVPLAAVIAVFSREVLSLWTRDPAATKEASVLLTLLMTATALNSLNYMPYALQLANGWTRLALSANVAGCVALVPLIVTLAVRYGAIGAAAMMSFFHAASLAIVATLTHQRLLPGEERRFYVDDVLKPVAAALIVVFVGRVAFPTNAAWLTQVLTLGLVFAAALVASALAAPLARKSALGTIAAILE